MTPTTTLMRLDPEPFRLARIRQRGRAHDDDTGSETRFLEDDHAAARAATPQPAMPTSAIRAEMAWAEWRAFDGAVPSVVDEDAREPSGWERGAVGSGLARLERSLDRVLPAPLGTLLQLFVCVSLALALMSAVLPLIDRL